MLKDIVCVELLSDFRLHLEFEDGIAGDVDVAALVPFEGVFEPLRDKTFFDRVRVDKDSGTIVWPNGADLDPDVLYALVSGEPLPNFAAATFKTG